MSAALSFIFCLPLSSTLPALDNCPLLLLIVFVSCLIFWESTAGAGLDDDGWQGVCQQKTNLPVSPPAIHCHCFAFFVCHRICYEIAEMGVGSQRLVRGSEQKVAAYLTNSHRLLWLLIVIRQATVIAIAVHHHHSLLSMTICRGMTMGGETYLCCFPPPPLVIDDFGGKTYLRCYLLPIFDHFIAVCRPLLQPVFDHHQPLLSIAAERG